MELKLNSWYSKWFSFVYLSDKKPKNLCTFFWMLLFSPVIWILSNPLWIFAFIWRKWKKGDVDGIYYVIPILFNILFIIIPEEPHWYLGLINGWVALSFIIISACTILLVSIGVILLFEKIKMRPKSSNIVGQRIKDFKSKTCTLIRWK